MIFDIGQVIIRWIPQQAFAQVMPADEVDAFMTRIGFDEWNRGNDARASTAGAEDELVRRFPADEVGIRGYRTHFVETIREAVPGTAAVIAELDSAGVRIGALTNWASDSFTIARKHYPILDRFADIVVSGDEGLVKPDPAIFRLACRRLGTTPEHAIFVDDSPANVAGAEAIGMTGILFTSAEQLRADLVALGLLKEPQASAPA